MNNRVKILLMDDIHLEGRPLNTYVEFHDIITEKVNNLRSEGYTPIIIFAGDIGEGLAGLNWFKSIKCDIVYVLGNHEFWGQDYFEEIKNVQEEVKKPGLEHIHFLHNDTKIVHGIRFIGGTLWSTIGDDFPWTNRNHIIRYHNVMGDFKRITAKGWYTPENIQRLKDYFKPHDVPETIIEKTIANETFNPLLETEESIITANYIFDELSKKYDGKTIVVTHHLPFREEWIRYFNMTESFLTQANYNDESIYLDVARGKTQYSDKDLLLLGLYTNNLSERIKNVNSPDFWVHGHLHRPINEFIMGTSVKSCPVGYFKQSATLSYKEFDAYGNKEEFKDYIIAIVENGWKKNMLSNLKGFEQTIHKFKELIDNNIINVEAFFAIANAFVGNHEHAKKEIDKNTVDWLYKIYQWQNPNTKLEKTKMSIANLKDLTGFTDFMKKHENSNDFRSYNISVKVDHSSFLEKDQFKALWNEEYKEKKNYHYLNWLREINELQLNAIRYRKAFIEFLNNIPDRKVK